MQVKTSTKLSAFEGRILSWAQMTGTLCADDKRIGSALRFKTGFASRLQDQAQSRFP